jgi:hypothetical protein
VIKFLHVHCRFGMSLGSQGKESVSCDMEKTKDEEEQENKTLEEKIRDASWHDRILWDQREFNEKNGKNKEKITKTLKRKTKKGIRLMTVLYHMAWALGLFSSLCLLPLAQAVHTDPVASMAETAGRDRFSGPVWSNGTLPSIFTNFAEDTTCDFPLLHATGPSQGPHGGAHGSAMPWRCWLSYVDAAAAAAEAATAAAANECCGSFEALVGNQPCNVSGTQSREDWPDILDKLEPSLTAPENSWFIVFGVWGLVVVFALIQQNLALRNLLGIEAWFILIGSCIGCLILSTMLVEPISQFLLLLIWYLVGSCLPVAPAGNCMKGKKPSCADMLGLDIEWLGSLLSVGCFCLAGSFKEPVLQLMWIGLMFTAANFLPAAPVFTLATHSLKGTKPKKKRERTLGEIKFQIKQWARQTAKAQRCVFSCRKIQKRRFSRTWHDQCELRKTCFWIPSGTQRAHAWPDACFIVPHFAPDKTNVNLVTSPSSGSQAQGNNGWIRDLRGGKGGSAATRRRREQGKGHGKNDLAGALSNFLADWTSNGNVPKQTNHRQTHDMSLARVLLDTLKQCMNNGESNAEVAATIGKILNTHGNSDEHERPALSRHTIYRNNTERLQTWDDEDPGPPRKKLRAQINDRKRTVTFNDKDLPPPKKGKGWGSQKPSQSSVLGFENNGQSLSQTQKGPSCASHDNQHEWTAGSKLCTLNQVQKAFQDGSELPGNLLITRDNRVTQQIKTLWQAHGSKLAFTVAEVLQSLPGETASGPPMTVWWGKPALSRPKLHKLKVVQMTDAPGPVPKQGKRSPYHTKLLRKWQRCESCVLYFTARWSEALMLRTHQRPFWRRWLREHLAKLLR